MAQQQFDVPNIGNSYQKPVISGKSFFEPLYYSPRSGPSSDCQTTASWPEITEVNHPLEDPLTLNRAGRNCLRIL